MERGHLVRILLRRSFSQPTVEGEKSELFRQGRPQPQLRGAAGPKGLLWPASEGRRAPARGGSSAGRFSFIGTVAATDMSRATDSREAGRVGIFGSAMSYGGSYGRVTNEAIGRDVNPLGRGGGYALVGGMQNLGKIQAQLSGAVHRGGSQGNSSNNGCCGANSGGGGGRGTGGDYDPVEEYLNCASRCNKAYFEDHSITLEEYSRCMERCNRILDSGKDDGDNDGGHDPKPVGSGIPVPVCQHCPQDSCQPLNIPESAVKFCHAIGAHFHYPSPNVFCLISTMGKTLIHSVLTKAIIA